MLAQHLHDGAAFAAAHLQHHTQFFVEQGAQRLFVPQAADLLAPVLGFAAVDASVVCCAGGREQHVDIERHAHVAGKGHFGRAGQQAAVAAVMICKDLILVAQRVNGFDEIHQILRIVQIGHATVTHCTALPQHLTQDAAAHAVFAPAQVNQQEMGFCLFAVELRREGAAYVIDRGKSAHDQTHGRGYLLGLARSILPLRAHRQRILAYRDGNTQLRAQLHAHGLHGAVQRGVFAGFAAGSHPVGAELDARKFNGCGQKVGDGFGHGHAARCRGIEHRQRRALAHAHGFACHADVVGQRHGHVGHRHLPGAHHLVAMGQAAYGAIANGDEKTFARHRGVRQYLPDGVIERCVVHAKRCGFVQNSLHIALHFGRLAQQHVHGHIHRPA